ncbi:MAG: Sporulation initiation inhibitor protein Soj (plasmid) [Chroococcopsis gigantea SAG 12.99]|jgi:chromosome partitioning protein|nr:ParA family protein [Chlorogloea purpurea SAG 13.99]MDV3002824.1 Sporulation initiation inhibitor protein Soj [Chroococcopsis gigantea SAG 12.99]
MLKVAVFNFKGGTGKSTTVGNLGACLCTRDRSIVLIDLDGQRTLSFSLGLDGDLPTALDFLSEREVTPIETSVRNLWLIPGALEMFQLSADEDLFTPALDRLSGYDICLMDCSPGLGVSSVQAILSSDRILIPVICEPAVLKGLSEAVQLIRGDRPEVPIDVVRVRYRPRLVMTKEADDLLTEAAPELNFRLLKTCIPEGVAVAESIAHSVPVTVYAPRSAGAKAYKSLAKEYLKVWYGN